MMRRSIESALLILFLFAALLVSYLLIPRDQRPDASAKTDYAYHMESGQKSYLTTIGSRIEIPLSIENRGKLTWPSKGNNPCFISYHLLDGKGNPVSLENRRFAFPGKVKPRQEIKTNLIIRAPLKEGDYTLDFDLLREGLFWFKDQGAETMKVSIIVRDKEWAGTPEHIGLDYGKYTRFSSSFGEIDTMYALIRMTLEWNEVEFEGNTGKVSGFSAGKNYPQIWLRDGNTIIPASKYFYGVASHSSWLEEHLTYQKENGALEDWFDWQGRSDKNTTETDQETSAVQAANQICLLLGPQWLEKKVSGESIIDRLERSLTYVFENRLNPEYGLLVGAHTADWGDVDMVDEGKEAVYVDERTHWTADIYDQSMGYQACLSLSSMMESLGRKEKSLYWREKARLLKTNSNKQLWQQEKGFYRVHIHLDSLRHEFNEDDIFALGGNTQAIISGVADVKQSRRIIGNALNRQKAFNISTISGTLLPPYPERTFKHPLLDDPFEYQNGAQWDWFGGKFIQVLFEQGYSRLAREKLAEIMAKNISNRGFFEWDSQGGEGRGSDYFCGSAGSLGMSIFEGYFGLKMDKDSLTIAPKMLSEEGTIHAYLPANDVFIAYEYQADREKTKIIMDYNSNVPQKGTIEILCPWTNDDSKGESRKKTSRVLIDGKEVAFRHVRRNDDALIVFETDFRNRRAEIYF